MLKATNSAYCIVGIGDNGGARGNVHRGHRGAATDDGNTTDDHTADNNNVVGKADDILC